VRLPNRTHAYNLRSWVESANSNTTDFPIQNLPFSVFKLRALTDQPRCGVGIGDMIFDISRCIDLFSGVAKDVALACGDTTLNGLMSLGYQANSEFRARVSDLLNIENLDYREQIADALYSVDKVDLLLPVKIGGFTDFFASINHATNAGRLFRPDAPLLPNYKYVPIAYNGRANSVRVSGEPVQRPWGQLKSPEKQSPSFEPAKRMDYEVELGLYIGKPSVQGSPIHVSKASDHIFGFSLLNDWSARDIQSWEYQP
jgi:fumarylacetoacetase